MGRKYPAEVHEFILANYKGISSKELSDRINEQFDFGMTPKRIHAYKKNHHLSSGVPGGHIKNEWSPINPPGLYEFIRDKCQGMSKYQTAQAVNIFFGSGTMTADQAAAYRKNHHIPCGRDTRFKQGQECPNRLKKGEYFPGCEATWFQKGNVPANQKEVGEISRRGDGVQIKKIQEKGTAWERWKPIHHIVYEEHFGKIPEGKIVGFKDGNIDNLDPDNLFLMTNEENLEMNRRGTRSAVPEITDARLNLAKVRIAIRNRKKGQKNEEAGCKT